MRANRAIVFGLIASSSLVYAMQFSMASVALPELMLDLDAPLRLGSWGFIIFMIGQVVALPVAVTNCPELAISIVDEDG